MTTSSAPPASRSASAGRWAQRRTIEPLDRQPLGPRPQSDALRRVERQLGAALAQHARASRALVRGPRVPAWALLGARPGVAGRCAEGRCNVRRGTTVLSRATLRVCRKARMAPSECRVERAPGRLAPAGRDGEAGVEAREEALEHGLRLADGGGCSQWSRGGPGTCPPYAPPGPWPAVSGRRQADPQLRSPARTGSTPRLPRAAGRMPGRRLAVAVEGERDA